MLIYGIYFAVHDSYPFTTPKYNLLFTRPVVEDICVVSVVKDAQDYRVSSGFYKSDSNTELNYTKIKLYKSWLSNDIKGDLTAIEYFINSNGTETNFYGDEGTTYLTKNDGTVIKVYPKLMDYTLFWVVIGIVIFVVIFVFIQRYRRGMKNSAVL